MNNKKVDIYLITNTLNGKQYVGQTVKGYKYRFNQHCSFALNKRKTCSQVVDAHIKKFGINNFKVELLEQVDYELRNEKEQYYIQLYNTYENGYNYTIGGDYNPMLDLNVKEKHKLKMKSSEVRNKISKGVLKSLNKDKIEYFRSSTRTRWLNWDNESRNNCIKGLINYNNSRKVKIGCMDENDNILYKFDSISEACKFLNKPSKEGGHILKVCDKLNKNGKRAKHFGYSWIKL